MVRHDCFNAFHCNDGWRQDAFSPPVGLSKFRPRSDHSTRQSIVGHAEIGWFSSITLKHPTNCNASELFVFEASQLLRCSFRFFCSVLSRLQECHDQSWEEVLASRRNTRD